MRAAIWVGLVGVAASVACAGGEPGPTVEATSAKFYVNGRVLRGDDSPPIERAAFVVEDGVVTRLAGDGNIDAPDGATTIDLEGRTVMPVLHSLHAHVGYLDGRTFTAEHYSRESVLSDLQRYAFYGIGSVAVLGSDTGDVAFEIRDAQTRGELSGYARLFTAGRGITTKGGWPTVIPALADAPTQVTTEAEARAAVAGLSEQRVDLVKIWVDDNLGTIPTIPPEIAGAAIDEAHERGLRVVAHVFYLDDAKALVRAGVDGLVHSIRDREIDAELIELMRAAETFYVPTLVAHETAFSYADAPAWVGEPAMRATVPSDMVDWLQSDEFLTQARQNPALEALRGQYRVAEHNVKALSDAGVVVALGTDSGTMNRFPGYVEHRELELMVAAGLSPSEALSAGTRNAAAMLEIERGGTFGAGKRADFIVVDGDPLTDITTTREIVAVSYGGDYLDRDTMAIRAIRMPEERP